MSEVDGYTFFNQTHGVSIPDVDRAVVHATASIVLSLIVYVFSLIFCCWRRCCNVRLGLAKDCMQCWGCDKRQGSCWCVGFKGVKLCSDKTQTRFSGRCFTYSWATWIFMWTGMTLAVTGAITMGTFYVTPQTWTVPYQRTQIPTNGTLECHDDVGILIGPCRMSFLVFNIGLWAYVSFMIAFVLSFLIWIPCCPFAVCCMKTYMAYDTDDLFDLEGCRYPNKIGAPDPDLRKTLKQQKATAGLGGGAPRQLTWGETIEFKYSRVDDEEE